MNPSIEIKRQRIFIDHSSKAKTFINEEFTIRSLESEIDNIVIINHNFLPNLHVYDSDGEDLPIMNNSSILDLLNQQKESKKIDDATKRELEEHIKRVKKKEIYIIWIKLPPTKKMIKNQLRIINFEYDSIKETKPSSKITTNYVRNLDQPVFHIIKKPKDYDFKHKPKIEYTDNNDKKHIFDGWKNKDTNHMYLVETADTISVTAKPKDVKTAKISYSFTGARHIVAFPLIVIGILLSFSLGILYLSQCEWFWGCEQLGMLIEKNTSIHLTLNELLEKRIDYLIAVAGASLVIPRLISNTNIRHDYMYWFLIPLGLAILTFFLMGV